MKQILRTLRQTERTSTAISLCTNITIRETSFLFL